MSAESRRVRRNVQRAPDRERLLAEVAALRAENDLLRSTGKRIDDARQLLDIECDRLRAENAAMALTDAECEALSRLRDQTMAYGRNPKALAVLDKLLAARRVK